MATTVTPLDDLMAKATEIDTLCDEIEHLSNFRITITHKVVPRPDNDVDIIAAREEDFRQLTAMRNGLRAIANTLWVADQHQPKQQTLDL